MSAGNRAVCCFIDRKAEATCSPLPSLCFLEGQWPLERVREDSLPHLMTLDLVSGTVKAVLELLPGVSSKSAPPLPRTQPQRPYGIPRTVCTLMLASGSPWLDPDLTHPSQSCRSQATGAHTPLVVTWLWGPPGWDVLQIVLLSYFGGSA